MKAKLLIAAAIVFVLIIVFGVRATLEVGRSRAALAALSLQRDQLQRNLGQLEAHLRVAKASVVALEAKSRPEGSRANAGASAAGADAPADSRKAGPVTPLALIGDDPAQAAAYLATVRAGVGLQYGALFKRLGLSPAQMEAFKDLEVELTRQFLDLQAAVSLHGLDREGAEYNKLYTDLNLGRAKQKAQVLGDLTARYTELYRSDNLRDCVRVLVSSGLVTGEPITSAQVDRAGDILAANCRRGTHPDSYPGWTQMRTLDWAAASEQLKAVLSPNQIEILRLQIDSAKLEDTVATRTNLLTTQFKKQSGAR